eukprot:12439212-Ditylum_brightwellii.AAC.1
MEGNRPAKSKILLLQTWPLPKLVKDIARIIGFGSFYSQYMPYFETRILSLRLILLLTYDKELGSIKFGPIEQSKFKDTKKAILSCPILQRADTNKCPYLRTDFSKIAMGAALLQPGDDNDSIDAMKDKASRHCKDNEKYLHSYLGEGYIIKYGINKSRHVLWACPFTAIKIAMD